MPSNSSYLNLSSAFFINIDFLWWRNKIAYSIIKIRWRVPWQISIMLKKH